MKVYLLYKQDKHSWCWDKRLDGVYASKKAAQAKIPKNPNTASYDYYIKTVTIKEEKK